MTDKSIIDTESTCPLLNSRRHSTTDMSVSIMLCDKLVKNFLHKFDSAGSCSHREIVVCCGRMSVDQ